jgi:hypothetical protein
MTKIQKQTKITTKKTTKTTKKKTNTKKIGKRVKKLIKRSTCKRSRKGGDRMRDLAEIKTKNNEILATAQELSENNPDLEDIEFIVNEAMDESSIIKRLIEQELKDEETDRENSNKNEVPFLQQTVNTDNFNGTVGELLSKIIERLGELRERTGFSHEEEYTKLLNLVKGISNERNNINNIKEILNSTNVALGGRIKNKNNNKNKNRTCKQKKQKIIKRR